MPHFHARVSESLKRFFIEQVKKNKLKTQKQYLVLLAMKDGYEPQPTDF